jgi:hypothetical protein
MPRRREINREEEENEWQKLEKNNKCDNYEETGANPRRGCRAAAPKLPKN